MQIDRKAALADLEPLKPAIASRSNIVALSHIWFDGTYAYACDGGLGIRNKTSINLNCGVPGTTLLGMLNQSAAGNIEIADEPDDNKLSFKSGRSKVDLATLGNDARVWRYGEAPGKAVAKIKISADFLKALKKVFILKPSAPKRMEHYAVCIYATSDKDMDLYVTDSNSMVCYPVDEPINGKVDKIALPRPLAEQIVARCPAGTELVLYSDRFEVKVNDKLTLYANTLDTTDMIDMPSYVATWTGKKGAPTFPFPDSFTAALERAVLLAGTEPPFVVLRAQGKSLKLSAAFKLGSIKEDFPLKQSIPNAEIKVDAKVLTALADITEMSVASDVIGLFGENDFAYFLSGQVAPKVARDDDDGETAAED